MKRPTKLKTKRAAAKKRAAPRPVKPRLTGRTLSIPQKIEVTRPIAQADYLEDRIRLQLIERMCQEIIALLTRPSATFTAVADALGIPTVDTEASEPADEQPASTIESLPASDPTDAFGEL